MRTMLIRCVLPMLALMLTSVPSGRASAAGAEDYPQTAQNADTAGALEVENFQVQIARWYDGKKSAFSVQFEGSDPSHLAIAMPVMSEYNRQPFVGTFFPDLESEWYQDKANRRQWDIGILRGRHEAGQPDLRAPQIVTVGSDPATADIVGVEAFTRRTNENVAAGGWMALSFHAIGSDTGLGVGERDFRQMMNDLSMKRYRWNAWIGGVAQVHKYQVERDAARVSAEVVSPTKVKIEITCDTDPAVYDQPLTLQIDFRSLWPDYNYDVEVLDSRGRPIPALRQSNLGPPLYVPIPPRSATYYVQATDPRQGKPSLPAEAARSARDEATGLVATICQWYDGRRAAVSFRFDDSYPSNVLTAVPMLREFGWAGTFFINPGNADYMDHKAAWEACAAQGDQEFANHTMHHNGALNDREVDRELGQVSRYLWSLFPNKSKLTCFNSGGGTVWTFSRPFRYYLDRYSLITPGASISMTDASLDAYRAGLDRAIERRSVYTSLFHQIFKANNWVSPETFHRVLEVTKEREAEIWVAGVVDVQKYYHERNAATLALSRGPGQALTLKVSCVADRELYDQPLTIELALPDGWSAQALRVTDANSVAIATRAATVGGQPIVCFDVPPVDSEYVLRRTE